MPDTLFHFAILRAVPDARRGEVANVGMVIFLPERLDVRVTPALHKVRALDPRLDVDAILALADTLPALAAHFPDTDTRYAMLRSLGAVQLSPLGVFKATGTDDYERQIQAVMDDLVATPPRPRDPEPVSKLVRAIKDDFRRQNILGDELDDIDRHLVVHRYPLGQDSLAIDFALRNGCWHLTEAIDFKGKEATLRTAKFKESALKAVTLDSARKRLSGSSIPLVVYQAKGDAVLDLVQDHLSLLSDYAERLYNYADPDDRGAYLARMAQAAGHLV